MPETVRAPPDEAINVPDAKAMTIDFSAPCQRCQVECDYCLGWRTMFEPEGGDQIQAAGETPTPAVRAAR